MYRNLRFSPLFLSFLLYIQPVWPANYEDGRQAYIEGNYKKALRILTPLAKSGDSEAQKMLGIMFDYGHGVKANQDKAMEWYLRAANQGHPAVQYQVGAKYFRGDGVVKNITEAARWWELAASGGQIEAQFNLGLLFFRGLGIEQNDTRAAELFRLAAEQGHGHAQYSLAVMYSFGRGVDKNYETALQWFEKSAAQGVAQAQFNLGVFYENGYAVDSDPATAREWYERAAGQGLHQARAKLEQMQATPAGEEPVLHPDDVLSEEIAAAARTAESTVLYDPREDAAITDTPLQPGPVMDEDMVREPPAEETPGVITADLAEMGLAVENGAIRREDWVRLQPAGNYTLQLGSVLEEKDIRRFINEYQISEHAAYIEVNIDGVTRFNALYGAYDSYSQAQQAIETLPAGLRRAKPWVRNFGMLQKLLN